MLGIRTMSHIFLYDINVIKFSENIGKEIIF